MMTRASGLSALVGGLAAAAIVIVSGCANSVHPNQAKAPFTSMQPSTVASSESAASSAKSGWLATEQSDVAYLQFTRSGVDLVGSIQIATEQADPSASADSSGNIPQTVTGTTYSFTGTLKGSALTVQVVDLPPWFGTLTGSTLVLNVPQKTGDLAPLRFHRGSVASYNSAVAALRDQADQANTAAAKQAQQAQAEVAYQQASDQLSNAVDALKQDVKTTGVSSYGDVVSQYQSDLAGMQRDWQSMQSDSCDALATDADGLATDENGIQTDDNGLQSVDEAMQQWVQSINNDIATAQSALSYLNKAAAAAGHSPALDTTVGDPIQAARTAIVKAQGVSQSAHDQATSIDQQAKSINAQGAAFATAHQC